MIRRPSGAALALDESVIDRIDGLKLHKPGRRVRVGEAPRNTNGLLRAFKRGKPTRRWTLGHQKIRRLSREGDVQMKVSPSGCPRYLTLAA
jgi:hypothetical protein